jgi:predicted O-methyltransferase YrrM
MLQGMGIDAALVSVDSSHENSAIARRFLGGDTRVTFVVQDGGEFILAQPSGSFDLVFADCWPGTFTHLDETVRLLRPGGLYAGGRPLASPLVERRSLGAYVPGCTVSRASLTRGRENEAGW